MDSVNDIIRLIGHTASVYNIRYSPDSPDSPNRKTIASSSDDNTTRIWDIDTGKCLKVFEGHTAAIYDIKYSPNGAKLASCSLDNTVRIWDMDTGKNLYVLENSEDDSKQGVYSIDFSPDGKTLASGNLDNNVRIWCVEGVESGKLLRVLDQHTAAVYYVCYSSDGSKLAASSADKTTIIWDLNNTTSSDDNDDLSTFSLNKLLSNLKDPVKASQLAINTVGNVGTLASLLLLINKYGLKKNKLATLGTITGFCGWLALVAERASEDN